jgi:hypothetical protein
MKKGVDEPSNDAIRKYIEDNQEEVVRILRPHMVRFLDKDLERQPFTEDKSGEKYQQQRILRVETITTTGTPETVYFKLAEKYAFKKLDTVVISINAESNVAMYGKMITTRNFSVTVASPVTAVKIKILLRGY